MAIRLRVRESRIRLAVSEGVPVYPPFYTGPTEVTPSEQTQILSTAGQMARENIVIEPIPDNYGRIAYNGTTLLVY